jgi:flavodoxin
LHVIYASTSGHTEYVVERLAEGLKTKGIAVSVQRAELAKPEDLSSSDVLMLASSTWNTGNVEGQLNPHMEALLRDRAKGAQLNGKKVVLLALGDKRYRYLANAAVHMEEYVTTHGGTLLLPTFKMINEPYGQEAIIDAWVPQLHQALS